MKTTVVLPDPIFRQAKAATALQGRTLRSFILTAIVHELEDTGRVRQPASRVRLPLVRSRRPGKLKITGQDVSRALLAEDADALA
jgi:hypothetical protein